MKVSACVLIFLCFSFLTVNLVFADSQYRFPQVSEGQITEALQGTVPLRFLPSHPLYFLISAKETINRFFQPSSTKKAEFDLVLVGKRLKETYLLLQKNDIKGASRNLSRYGQRINKMISQLEKARSQNQDVGTLAAKIAEDLRYHEILFFAIDQERQNLGDDKNFNENFEKAASDFTKAVMAIDKIKPGLKNRFQTVVSFESSQEEKVDNPIPTPSSDIFESSPSVKPRRIIY